MKRIELLYFLMFCVCASINADVLEEEEQEIELEVTIEDPFNNNHSIPRTPIRPPHVTYSNLVLHFKTSHPDYALQLATSEDVVYETTVYSIESLVLIPSLPSGEYEIILTSGNISFHGFITITY
ncbi:MAG: hypothetical protein J5957_06090 [Prevotella sp.]|nr:hypothetical protein [Prevotella sp.]